MQHAGRQTCKYIGRISLMNLSMSYLRIAMLTTLAMLAFAGNSILCRIALRQTPIDPASFTAIRLVSGALTLWMLVHLSRKERVGGGSWGSAVALVAYAAGFSFAYVTLTAATGALILFGAVQATMIGRGLWLGERLQPLQWAGLVVAMAGLVVLLSPGLSAPPLAGALLMLAAGLAWGVYSLRGRGAGDPVQVTAGNFMRAVPFSLVLWAVAGDSASLDIHGVLYALASGAIASGLGYVVWYTVLPALKATSAAIVQLSVPVVATLGGVLLLSEGVSPRLLLASVAVIGGIAMVVLKTRK